MQDLQSLSEREAQVADLLLQGKSNKQIAFALFITERTVEFHLTNIYTKLNIGSRVELILHLQAEILSELGEPTVEKLFEKLDNDKQPKVGLRSMRYLNIAFSLIKKELVMIKVVFTQDVGAFFKKYPLVLGLALLVTVSFVTRYLIIGMGLYFWVSYIVLGILLAVVGIYFGWTWDKLMSGEFMFNPWVVLALVLSPLAVAVVDSVLLHTVAKNADSVMVSLLGISNKATWLTNADGVFYLHKERSITQETLWVYFTVAILLLSIIGKFAQQRFDFKN